MVDDKIVELQSELETLLLQVAKIKQINNYEIKFDESVLKGDGFLGEFFLGSVKNKDTNETVEVAIKKAFKNPVKREDYSINQAYQNENYFYSTVYPTLQQFQSEKKVTKPFNNIAKFFYGRSDAPNEVLLLENIKKQGYILKNKQDLLDEEHAEYIFELYGRFHALSFALKDQNFELYRKLVDGMQDILLIGSEKGNFQMTFNEMSGQAFDTLDPKEDAEIINKYKEFFKNAVNEFRNSLVYKGDYGIINHGDCWSNNMMFKYSDSGKLEDMKLIDFQLIKEGTPVYDLSYFFYTGGCKALFDKLDDYLKIYHDSLSKNLRELGSDPEKLYPFKQLKEDWKNYGKFGVLFSLLLVKVKLLDKSDIDKIVDDDKEYKTDDNQFISSTVDEDLYKERCRDILRNAYQIDMFR